MNPWAWGAIVLAFWVGCLVEDQAHGSNKVTGLVITVPLLLLAVVMASGVAR